MSRGKFSVDILSLERFRLDGGAMFGIVPKPLWERSCPADSANRIAMGCQCLLVRKDDRVILVDAGMGTKWDTKGREIYDLQSDDCDPLSFALSKHGLKLGDITDVIVTHLHFDHAGGLTRLDETGRLGPTLPQARHWVQAEHLEWALSPTEKDRGSFPSENIQPLIEADLFHLVRGEESLVSGLELHPLHGHTRGMQAVLIEGEETVFYPADLLPMQAHLHLPYIMAYDIAPLVTLAEKKRFLRQAERDGWRLVFEHEPVGTSGRVEMFQGKYRLGKP